MNRIRLVAVLLALAAAAVGLTSRAPEALAAAEIHRFNLVLSAMPGGVDGGDFNTDLDYFNRNVLEPNGLESLEQIKSAWLFEGGFRYFVRSNVAMTLSVGQMKAHTSQEYLPGLSQSIEISGEVLSVPVNVGAAYYMAPYNQGDFQARAFVGGGISSLVYSKALLQNVANVTDSLLYQDYPVLRTSSKEVYTRDAPGWFAEVGVHMFFAARYSVMLSGVYRSAKIDEMIDRETGQPVTNHKGEPFSLDMSGMGLRAAAAIGF